MSGPKLGATGKFPAGKLHESDEGQLRAAMAVRNNRLLINFGKSVAWVALTKRDVRRFIELLEAKERELDDVDPDQPRQ